MTAEEIRKLRDESVVAYKIDGSLDERNQLMFFLSEVAAQLAEMNERANRETGDTGGRRYRIHHRSALRTAVGNLLAKLDQLATDELVSGQSHWSEEYSEEFKAVKALLS